MLTITKDAVTLTDESVDVTTDNTIIAKVNSNLDSNINSASHSVWKTVEARHFILNFLLVILWSSAIRPINREYASWFLSRVRLANSLLNRLSEPGWAIVEPIIEDGIAKIKPIVSECLTSEKPGNVADTIEILSYYHFKRYDRSWSSLRPVNRSFQDEWESPSKLFFAFGPHIGIGDEMILFLAIEAFMRKFPNLNVEVWSHSKDLWRWNTKVDAHHINDDALEPFIRAQSLIESDPKTFIAFCDFTSDKIYRELETVSGFHRFFYLDIGTRLVRLVNQSDGCISEYECVDESLSIYDALKDLLNNVGIETPKLGSLIQPVRKVSRKSKFQVFLNPHSSKEKNAVSAQWWADAIHRLGVENNVEVNIVSGINDANQSFSESIAKMVACASVKANVLPKMGLDNIIKTALDHDIILGLDTFTAHMNTISKVNCVTVFFGPSGDSWHVPLDNVLNLQITDEAKLAGDLARLLLLPIQDKFMVSIFCKLAACTDNIQASLNCMASCEVMTEWLNEILGLTKDLFAYDQKIAEIFSEYSMSHIEHLKGVVKVVNINTPISALQSRVLQTALRSWKNSNLSRYSKFIASESLEQVAD